MNDDKTIRKPVDDESDKTLRKPAGDGDKTLRKSSDSDKTKAISKNQINKPKAVPEIFILNGESLKLIKIISENSSEAQIYLVENEGKEYVLKLYYPQFKPKKELLNVIKSFDFHGIVKLFDFGECSVSFESTPRFFEIMEYLQGGELDTISYAKDTEKLKEIAIQAAAALAYCHNNRIIHKDVKPGNFFFRDKEHKQLVLGDFGIASLCDEDELMHQTQQARTPIYAAPEMYISIDDNVEIDGKVDFYSLGILLMYVWTGQNPFKEKERSMTNMKRLGELPYPKDAPVHILQIMQGLTVIDPKKRWGFDEVKRWYDGEFVKVEKKSLVHYSIFNFDHEKNLVANDPAELALLMEQDQKLAIKYLYGSRVKDWLKEAGNNKLYVELEEICEKRYPRNQQAGLRTIIYLFNSNIQYKAADGNYCADENAIIEAIYKNRKKYTKVLQNPDDDLYIYLESIGKNKEKDTINKFFKQLEPHVAIWKTLYYLNQTLPFVLEIENTNGNISTIECKTVDELIVAFRKNNISDDGWNSFIDGRFLAWYKNQFDSDTYKIIEKILADEQIDEVVQIYAVLFYLNRQVSFNLYLPGEDDNYYYFTKEDIGNLFNQYAKRKFQDKENNPYLDMCIDELENKKSILYYYFESKNWTTEIDWFKYCFELNNGDNKNKCGPYNKEIALYKAIKGIGFDPYFYFKKSKTEVSTLEALSSIKPEEIKAEIEKGTLKNWLTIFYQENPFADLKTKASYEKLTREYTEKVYKLNNNDKQANRFYDAIAITDNMKLQVKNRLKALNLMQILLGFLFVLLAGLLLTGIIVYKIPLKNNPLPIALGKVSYIYWLFATIVIGGYTWRRDTSKELGILSSAIIGLISSFLFYYVIYIIVAITWSVMTIISIAVVVAGIAWFLWKAFGPFSSSKILKHELLVDFDSNTELVEPLYFAYRSGNEKFQSQKQGALENYYDDLKRQRNKLLKWIIPGILTFLILLIVFFMEHPHFYNVPFRKKIYIKAGLMMSDEQQSVLIGKWTGVFEGKQATFVIDSLVGDYVKGNVSVVYKKNVTEQLVGEMSFSDKKIVFYDKNKNQILDGVYTVSFTEKFDELQGYFEDEHSDLKVYFKFGKSQQTTNN